jgi:hypothetical protein
MAVKVTATLAKERTKAADEKPEDAKAKDEEFQTKIKALEEKLKTEQAFQNNVFEVSKYTIDSLLKSRAELLSKAADNAGPQAPPPRFDTAALRLVGSRDPADFDRAVRSLYHLPPPPVRTGRKKPVWSQIGTTHHKLVQNLLDRTGMRRLMVRRANKITCCKPNNKSTAFLHGKYFKFPKIFRILA